MDSNTHHNLHPQELQNHQPNSGLLRFRSAPSSLFANFAENGDRGVSKGNPIEGAGSESERLFSRFVNYSNNSNDSDSWPSSFQEFDDKSTVMASPMSSQQQQRYSHSGLPPHYPRQSSYGATGNGSYGLVGSAAVDHQTEAKTVHSNLVRQSSSPAGLFHHNSVQNGAGYGLNSTDGELSPSTNRWKGQNSFSLRLPSSLGMLPQISDIGSECIGANSPDNGKLGNGNADTRFNGTGFPFGTWNDPSNFADNLGGMRRDQDNDEKLFSVAQNGGELGNRIHILSHHLSLPKTSAEIAMEKFLQLQDSVPCKVRAKRGCATHPRSIAERVRRTRISERMRKLQELVPNMDKQTNTADMLDLAVEYIKDLQKQFKTLNDIRANCKCLKVQKPVSNQIV